MSVFQDTKILRPRAQNARIDRQPQEQRLPLTEPLKLTATQARGAATPWRARYNSGSWLGRGALNPDNARLNHASVIAIPAPGPLLRRPFIFRPGRYSVPAERYSRGIPLGHAARLFGTLGYSQGPAESPRDNAIPESALTLDLSAIPGPRLDGVPADLLPPWGAERNSQTQTLLSRFSSAGSATGCAFRKSLFCYSALSAEFAKRL